MGESPLFRVGDDVELWLMLFNLTVLALAVTAFEKALHALEKRLERFPKYHQMITKIYRELMILGILGLAIKMLKEAGLIKETSPETIAFVSADLTLFFLALALVFQAITIFMQLRWENKHMATLELLGSEELYVRAAAYERKRSMQSRFARAWSGSRFDEAVHVRILRNLFLRAHALPEIFPFAKYLREAQDNQISHMIDIELLMWLIVFAVAWSFYASISVVKDLPFSVDGDDNEDSNDSEEAAHTRKHYALALVFATFVWLLLLLHVLATAALDRVLRKLLQRAGVESKAQCLARLKQVAVEEATNLANEVTATAIKRMQDVLEEQQVRQHERHHRQLEEHKHGSSVLARLLHRGKKNQGAGIATPSTATESSTRSPRQGRRVPSPRGQEPHTHSSTLRTPCATQASALITFANDDALRVPGFSRKLWHFCVMLLLILNGLFSALFVQAVVYHLPTLANTLGVFVTALIPLPLVANWYVQPKLIRKFILVSSLAEVHVGTLSTVISGFTESVELQNSFISLLLGCLEDAGVTVDELEQHFEENDAEHSGWIDVEELRRLLGASVGFHMSFFKFTSVMRLLFQVQHLKVDYRKVLMLVRLASGQHDDLEHPGGGSVDHWQPSLREPSMVPASLDSHHTQQQLPPHRLHLKHSLLLSEHQRATSFIAILDGGARDFANSSVLLHDGLQRPSRITRQMMEAGSSRQVGGGLRPPFRQRRLPPVSTASFVSSESIDSASSSIAILGASDLASTKASLLHSTGNWSRTHQHFHAVSESSTLEDSTGFAAPPTSSDSREDPDQATPSATTSRYQRI